MSTSPEEEDKHAEEIPAPMFTAVLLATLSYGANPRAISGGMDNESCDTDMEQHSAVK
jgi:hypothetical protein